MELYVAALGTTITSVDGADTITFTVNDGYEFDGVYLNGAKQTIGDPVEGVYSFAKPESGNLVFSALKPRQAADHYWWESPRATKVGTFASAGDAGAFRGAADGDYVAIPHGMSSGYAYLFTADELMNADAENTAVPFSTVAQADVNGTGIAIRGAGVCQKLGIMLVGNYDDHASGSISVPLDVKNPVLGKDMFLIENDKGYHFDSAGFDENGEYVYVNSTHDDHPQSCVHKFKVINGLKGLGARLEWVASYDVGDRVRTLTYANNKVYCICNGNVRVLDLSTGIATTIIDSFTEPEANVKYGSLTVSGNYLTIASGTTSADNKYAVYVYELKQDGTATRTAAFDKAALNAIGVTGMPYGSSVSSINDNETLVLGWSNVYTIKYCPKYEVIFDAGETATTNLVWAGETTTAPKTDPVKAGYNFLGWFDGDGNEFDPEVPVMADATYTAKFELITYNITITAPQNGTLETSVTNNVAPGTTVTVTATPDAGYKLVSITTNGQVLAGTTFVMPAENVTVAATFEQDAQPLDPEQPKHYDSKAEAEAAAASMTNTDGTVKIEAIKIPAVVENKAAYAALFTVKIDANNDLVIDFTAAAEEAIAAELANEDTSTSLLNPEEGKVTITAKPGLFYGVKAVGDVSAIGTAEGQNWVQAEGTTVVVERPTVSGNAAFFQAVCTPKDPTSNK